MPQPTKASPAGCVLSLIGLIPLALAVVCVWGVITGLRAPEEKMDSGLITKLAIGALISLGISITMIRIGWKMALASDMQDPYDQDKPKMRF